MLKKFFILSALSLFLFACSSTPPSQEQVKESVKKIIPVNFEILQVKALKEVPSLFEVVLRVNNQPIVFYMDKTAKYVVSGSLLAIDTKTNLTAETQKKFLQK